MDNEDRRLSDIQSAIDAQFSGVSKKPELRQKVLRRVRGETVVKKKLSIGLVLLVVLLLAAAAALAISALSGYFSGYAQLENTHGEYSSDWPASAKVELIRLMLDNGMAVDQEKTKELLDGSLTEEQQNILASEVIEAYFSGRERINTYNIMLHELGQFEGWPYEQKALYSSLLVKYGHQKEEWPLYLTPEASDIQEKDAVELALKKLSEKFGIAEHLGNFPVAETTFFISGDYGEAPVWLIEFRNPDVFAGAYSVVLSRQGDIISFKAPDTLPFTGDDDILPEAEFAEPAAHDATKEQVVETAKFALGEIGSPFSKPEIEALTAEAYFIYHERFCYGWAPVWLVYMYQDDTLVYKALLGYDGRYMDIVSADMEFTNTILPGENFGDSQGIRFHELGFWEGSVEEKAAFSKKWTPLVDAFASAHPYYTNQKDLFYTATRYVYGIPDEDDMTQEDAITLAQQTILAMGASRETLAQRRIECFFDVTDPKRPLWKIVIFHADVDREAYGKDNNAILYRVIIDAKAGTVVESWEIPPSMDVSQWRF